MSSAQVESVAGFALLAVVVMVLCYLLPAAIRSRQIVADARIDDRFSTGLRVLARTGGTSPRVESTARVHLHAPATPTASSPTTTSAEPEAPMDRQPVPPASRTPAQARREAATRAARAAAASRRAAAARRRRVLLVGLFTLTAAGWGLFATITFPIAVPIAASVLLVAAAVAGRRAAVRAARAEDREHLAGPVGRTRRGGSGSAGASSQERPTTTRTGPVRHARRTSQGEAASPEGADDTAPADSGAATEGRDGTGGPAVTPPTRTPVSERTGSLRISVDPATIDSAVPGAEQDEGWTPVPVPVPTYALKEPAPRRTIAAYEAPQWEPQPAAEAPADAEQERELTLATVEQAVRQRKDHQAPPATAEQVLAEQEVARARGTAASTPAGAGEEPKRPTMDLQSVLERRRAVGH